MAALRCLLAQTRIEKKPLVLAYDAGAWFCICMNFNGLLYQHSRKRMLIDRPIGSVYRLICHYFTTTPLLHSEGRLEERGLPSQSRQQGRGAFGGPHAGRSRLRGVQPGRCVFCCL